MSSHDNINAIVKKSVLPVFVNSLPKDHYAQRTGQNFKERGINFFFPTSLQRENSMIIIDVTVVNDIVN